MDENQNEENISSGSGSIALKFFIFIVLSMIISSFAVRNMHEVEIHYYDHLFHLHSLEFPLLGVIFCSIFLGFMISWSFGILQQMKLRSRIWKQTRTLEKLSKQVEQGQAN